MIPYLPAPEVFRLLNPGDAVTAVRTAALCARATVIVEDRATASASAATSSWRSPRTRSPRTACSR